MPFVEHPDHQPVVLLAPGPHCHRSRVDTEVRVLHHVGQRLTDGQPQVFAHLGAGSQSHGMPHNSSAQEPDMLRVRDYPSLKPRCLHVEGNTLQTQTDNAR